MVRSHEAKSLCTPGNNNPQLLLQHLLGGVVGQIELIETSVRFGELVDVAVFVDRYFLGPVHAL